MRIVKLLFVCAMVFPALAFAQVAPPPSPSKTPKAAIQVPAPEEDVRFLYGIPDEDLVFMSALPGFGGFAMQEGQMRMRTPAPAGMPMQHPGPDLGKWWKNSEVVKEIQLTDSQINQIEQTFLDFRLKLIDLRADVERQEAKLQPLIEADQPDEAKVGAQLDLLLAARGRLEKANAMMMLSIRKILSVEQWKKLEEIKARREMRLRTPMPHEARPGQMMKRPAPEAPQAAPVPRTPRPPDSDSR
jgi:Spy/CpxP family protein refolding chaperone